MHLYKSGSPQTPKLNDAARDVGKFQNRIAASFDVNPGRVNEVLKERKHTGSKEDALKKRVA